MKTILLTLLAFISISTFCQIPIDSFYVDKDTYLIHSQVEEFDSTFTPDKIINSTKNWAGINFVNMENVLVSETNNQLVFNYVIPFYYKALGMKYYTNWYVRMVVQIKGNRSRFLFYDDGNCFIPASKYSISIQARQRKISQQFCNNSGFFRGSSEEGSIEFKKSIENTSNDLVNSIKNNQSIKIQSEW